METSLIKINKMNEAVNIELSLELAQRIKPPTRNCFERVYQASLLTEGSLYVQGFLVLPHPPYVPIEYSWITLEESIIDLTKKHLKNSQEHYYFPAQSLTRKELKSSVEEAVEDYPEDEPLPIYGETPYCYYGEVMLGGEAYKNAYEKALAKCRELKRKQLKIKPK